jgi:hypothetical protein
MKWMIDEASAAGLGFRAPAVARIAPNEHDVLHDSCTGIFSQLKTEPRQVPEIADDTASFAEWAWKRHQDPPLEQATFWTTTVVKKKETVTIFARERWNVTKLFLEKDVTYDFTASGEWLDGTVKCGPSGPLGGKKFNVGAVAQLAASALGQAEGLFNRLAGNPKADFIVTKRYEQAEWFAVVGVVANGALPGDTDDSLPEHEIFTIGEKARLTPKKSGYLYCYANDAWQAYGNNRGSVTLTVTPA